MITLLFCLWFYYFQLCCYKKKFFLSCASVVSYVQNFINILFSLKQILKNQIQVESKLVCRFWEVMNINISFADFLIVFILQVITESLRSYRTCPKLKHELFFNESKHCSSETLQQMQWKSINGSMPLSPRIQY